jgi:hypothetical protein
LWRFCSYNEKRSSSRLSHLEAPAPQDRGDILGDLTNFSAINGPLRAVKETKEHDNSRVDFIRHCGKSAAVMNKLFRLAFHTPESTPRLLDRGDISGDLTNFSSLNGPLRAVKTD